MESQVVKTQVAEEFPPTHLSALCISHTSCCSDNIKKEWFLLAHGLEIQSIKVPQSTERWVLLYHLLSVQYGTPAHGVVLLRSGWVFPSLRPLWKHPHR